MRKFIVYDTINYFLMSGPMDKLRFIHMTRMMLDVWYVMPIGQAKLIHTPRH